MRELVQGEHPVSACGTPLTNSKCRCGFVTGANLSVHEDDSVYRLGFRCCCGESWTELVRVVEREGGSA